MKSLRTGVLALLALGVTGANAGGLGDRGSIKDSPTPLVHWTGLYLGLQAGYAWGQSSDVPWGDPGEALVDNDGPASLKGTVGGIHVGFNSRVGNLVLGVEGDIEATALQGDDRGRSGDSNWLTNGLKGNWQASLRGQAGVLVSPRSLLYLTAGVAWLEADATIPDAPDLKTVSHGFTGWTIGSGIEHAFAPRRQHTTGIPLHRFQS